MNTKTMANSSNDRTLRATLLGLSILSLPLLIGGTVVSEKVKDDFDWNWYRRPHDKAPVPIEFSFIPVPITIVFSAVCLWRARRGVELCGRQLALNLLLDFGLTLSYLGVLIPFYIIEPRRLHNRANWMLLEAYASFFLVANMFIHFSLVCRNLKASVSSLRNIYSFIISSPKQCPHCHKNLACTSPQMSGGRSGREGYSLLQAEDYLDEDVVAFEGADSPDARRSGESGKNSMDV